MKLTKKQAIDLSIELWEYLAETGDIKTRWDGWGKYGWAVGGCFLCEYDTQFKSDCKKCPLQIQRGFCMADREDKPTSYDNWEYATTRGNRKKYAELFLEQLRALKQ